MDMDQSESFPRTIYDFVRGKLDYFGDHHTRFYPWGGPMNGQTARLEAVRQIIVALQPNLIIETGTYRATTTLWLAQFGIPVITVEVSRRFYEFSLKRLAGVKNARLVLDNSVHFLNTFISDSNATPDKVIFYIDSHWGEYLPLRDELQIIFREFTEALIIIDDFKVEDDDGYAFDDYGPGKALTTDYVMLCNIPSVSIFFPSVKGSSETGARRGSAFITASPAIAEELGKISLLKEWSRPTSGAV